MATNAIHQARILRRMEQQAINLGDHSAFEDCQYVGVGKDGKPLRPPRWRVTTRWVEFECGCRAERITTLGAPARDFDPVIFENLPEQAVYEGVCDFHLPAMNDRVRLGGYTFATWKERRRKLLMGK